MRIQSLGREDPLEKEMATHRTFRARITHGQTSLAGHSSRTGSQNQTRLSNPARTHGAKKNRMRRWEAFCGARTQYPQEVETQDTQEVETQDIQEVETQDIQEVETQAGPSDRQTPRCGPTRPVYHKQHSAGQSAIYKEPCFNVEASGAGPKGYQSSVSIW